MKKSDPQDTRPPSEKIDARIEELGGWRGKTLPGRPGWLPTQAPHRPVRAELPHTVLRATGSLSRCAIR